jgi:ATP-dependent DNA ligase
VELPIGQDHPPMEAELSRTLPAGEEWVYEPKWDGFRCLVFKDGHEVDLRSKAGKPLGRYFPELVELFAGDTTRRFVLDGEIVVPRAGGLDFDALLQRIHPAESRIRKLAAADPAHFIAFDLLVTPRGADITSRPLASRRDSLEKLYTSRFADHPSVHLSPSTADVSLARQWLEGKHGGLDGVMAKRIDLPYRGGERSAMRKVKRMRTADCVVGGFRWAKSGGTVGSLLLGLYDAAGDLHHVGFCSALNAAVRAEADERLAPLRGGSGFSGKGPQGQSRWRTEGSGEWEPLEPTLVVEVEYDHFSGGRFRHGTRFLRWRPDKAPEQCRLEQVEKEGRSALGML